MLRLDGVQPGWPTLTPPHPILNIPYMKRFALPALLALAGCDSSAISQCEDKIKQGMLAPASYQRVDAQIVEHADMIRVEFDADNALDRKSPRLKSSN